MKRILPVVIGLMLIVAIYADASKYIRVWWKRGSESGYDVQLVREDRVWNDLDNIDGTWSSVDIAYYFEFDVEDTAKYDPTKTYRIMENGVGLADSIMIGDIVIANDFYDHRDSTAAHGVSGDVVGDTDTQTLTNKTIDGDDNTVQDLHGWCLKAGTSVRAMIVHPDTGEDTYLHIDVATANGVTIQASDSTKSTDRVLTVIADSVDLQDDGGSDIILSGITSGTGSNTAVPKSVTDAIATRLDALERDDVFGGSPAITLRLANRGRSMVNVYFNMNDPDDADSLRRYEIYWSYQSLDWIEAGATSDAELATLRRTANRITMYSGEGNSISLNVVDPIWVTAVAFDWDDPVTVINSDPESIVPLGREVRRDAGGELIEVVRIISSPSYSADAATGNSASEYTQWAQATTTPKIKYRCGYVFHTNDVSLKTWFYIKTGADASDHGYVKIAVMNGASEVEAETMLIDYDSGGYPSTPQSIDLDVSGLTNGMLYELEVTTWSDDTHTTTLRSDIQMEVIAEVPMY
ncbi:MAG: hypothetical protein P9M15_00860 [Candidatus Electryoneaceae bacterium]|nr:hypothetical protein [Candidatus Electryoneaceae bacterium]